MPANVPLSELGQFARPDVEIITNVVINIRFSDVILMRIFILALSVIHIVL